MTDVICSDNLNQDIRERERETERERERERDTHTHKPRKEGGSLLPKKMLAWSRQLEDWVCLNIHYKREMEERYKER